VDYFAFVGQAGDRVYAYVQTSLSSQGQNSRLALVDTAGIHYLDYDDNDGTQTNQSSSIAGMVLPEEGVYFLRVSAAGGSQITPYRLWASVASGAAAVEIEPNNTVHNATMLRPGFDLDASLSTAVDADWYTVSAVAGQTIYVSQDNDPEGDGGWPARMQFIGTDSNTVLLTARDPGNGSPYPPSQALAWQATQSGTYYIRISARSPANLQRTYRLSVSLAGPPP
jgi:hypothetical protein